MLLFRTIIEHSKQNKKNIFTFVILCFKWACTHLNIICRSNFYRKFCLVYNSSGLSFSIKNGFENDHLCTSVCIEICEGENTVIKKKYESITR